MNGQEIMLVLKELFHFERQDGFYVRFCILLHKKITDVL